MDCYAPPCSLSPAPHAPDQAISVTQLVDLELKAEFLTRWQLPRITYALPRRALTLALERAGEVPLDLLLYGLQLRSSQSSHQWRQYEPAMARLAVLLAPKDDRLTVTAAGDDWRLEIGPVAQDDSVVAIQRGDSVIATIAPRTNGSLRIAACRPLDAKSASFLLELGRLPAADGSVGLRASNWEYVCDCAASTGNIYAASRGEASLSYWARGIDDHLDAEGLKPRLPAFVATELGTSYTWA